MASSDDGEIRSEEAGSSYREGYCRSCSSIQTFSIEEEQSLRPHYKEAVDPATRFVRSLEGDYLTLREAAEKIGISRHTLRGYIRDGSSDLGPGRVVQFGKVPVYLYNSDDVLRIKKNLENRTHVRNYKRTPRKSRYTEEQKRLRAQLVSKRYYWKNVRDDAEFFNEKNKYWRSLKKIEEIEESLEEIEREAL